MKKQKVKKRIISVVLVFALLISGISYGGKEEMKKVQAVDPGSVASVVRLAITLTGKVAKGAQNASSLGKDASSKDKAVALLDGILGTNFSNKPTVNEQLVNVQESLNSIENKTDALQKDVSQINESMNVANVKLDDINSKLDRQEETLSNISDGVSNLTTMVTNNQLSVTNQISGMSNRLEKLYGDKTEEMKVILFDSNIELQKNMTLLSNLDSYYNTFEGLSSVEETILKDLKNQQKSFEEFMKAVNALEDGQEIIAIIRGITMNYEESYEALTEKEKKLLSKEVTLSEIGTVTIHKFLKDYLSYMHTYMTETIYQKGNKYLSNIYDTVKQMGEYIVGETKETGYVGVGEIYYQSSMLEKSTNVEVHDAYKNFMSTVMGDYFITAYLCQLSLTYQVTYDLAHDGNVAEINTKKKYLKNVQEQMEKVQAYYGYELNHCIREYDFKGYKDGEFEKNLCYYGNSLNAKNGISNWRCKNKEDVYVEAALSDSSLELAVSEKRPLYFYQGLEDWTRNATWTSEDETVAVVNKNGMVTGVAPGSTTITAKFDTYELKCPVSVLTCFAKKNNTDQCNYNYGQGKYTLDSSRSYDYYYGADCYKGNKIVLSKERKSAGLVEATGLSEHAISQYTWKSADSSVAACQDGQITLTDAGNCVIYGFRYLEDEAIYECIGIPVCVTLDTSSEMEAEDELENYSDYTKISTKQDLIELSQNPSMWGPECKYVLTADIDLGGMEWTPIGYNFNVSGEDIKNVPFQGKFEGNGHVIKDFKITKIPHQDKIISTIEKEYEANPTNSVSSELSDISLGLFGYVNGASIRNLKVTGGLIKLDTTAAGKSFTIAGNSYTLTVKSEARVSAGLLAGSSALSYYDVYEELFRENDGNPAVLIENPDTSSGAASYIVNPDADISAYVKDMPNYIKDLGKNSIIMVHYIILEAFKQRKFPNTAVTNSYAEGSITINANNFTSGQVFAGGLFGMCACGVEKSSAKVSIQVKTENPSAITQSDNGALGGLIGIWTPWKNSNLSFCTAWADIESNTTALAGGLVGNMVSLTTYDRSQIMFTEDMLTNPTSEELENMEKLTEFCVAAEMLASIYAYIDMEGTGEYPNTRIENCQVYGSVDAGGSAAGLLGRKELGNQFEWTMKKNRASTDKVAKLFIPMEFGSFAVIETQKEKQPNLDIVECYVDVNVTTTGDYAAGIIATKAGGTKESKIEAEWGYVSKCYVHGNIAAGKVAAGVVAHEDETGDDHDYSRDCTAILYTIVACKSISANTVDSVKDTAVYPLWNIETMYSFGGELETLYYYDTIAYKRKQSGTVYTSASNTEYQGVAKTKTELNKTQTYLELWDPCFCNVSGLDYDKGFLPIVLEERCFFNTEDAKIYYHVGDAFEPITKGTLYTGNGSTTITTEDGLTSTEPDMTKPGIQKVTVSYKEQKKDYKIYVYPVTESYIKVTEKPTLEQNGDEYTLSGGKIGVYLSNGTLSRTVDFNECGVEYKEGYASITYEGMNTSMKILTLESYANKGVDEDELVKLGTWYYLSGDTVVASEIVEQKRKVSDQGQQRELNLLASSLSEDVTITSDMYVLSLYQKVGDEKPQPTPTPTPIPTKEPGNTPTPVPTKEPGNTPTPTPTITPVPTKTPVVTSTAKPTPGSGNTPVTSPTVSKKNAPVISMKKTVGKGAKIKLALAKDLGGVKVTYKTSNKKVATVSKKGVVSAKKKGSATITQTVTYRGGMYLVKLKLKVQAKKAKGKLYQPSIKVIKKGIPVTYMGETLKKGKTTAIRVKKGDSVTKVTYTTSNKKVATVSKTGKIKAKKKGKVKIIAKIKQGEHTYYSVMTVKVVN